MLKVRCPRHHRYNGERSPKAACDLCISLWHLRLKAITDRLQIIGAKPTAKEAKSE